MIGVRSEVHDNGVPQAEQNRSVRRFVRPHFGQVREPAAPTGGIGGGYIGANVGATAKRGPFMARAAIVMTSPTTAKMAIPTVSAWLVEMLERRLEQNCGG